MANQFSPSGPVSGQQRIIVDGQGAERQHVQPATPVGRPGLGGRRMLGGDGPPMVPPPPQQPVYGLLPQGGESVDAMAETRQGWQDELAARFQADGTVALRQTAGMTQIAPGESKPAAEAQYPAGLQSEPGVPVQASRGSRFR